MEFYDSELLVLGKVLSMDSVHNALNVFEEAELENVMDQLRRELRARFPRK